MIDQVRFQRRETKDGKQYEVATIWVGGVPFSADMTPHVETIANRIIADTGCDFYDARAIRDD